MTYVNEAQKTQRLSGAEVRREEQAVEQMLTQGTWPVDGYRELQEAVKRFINKLSFYINDEHFSSAEPKAQQVISALVDDDTFCPSSYLYLVYYMIAHVYVMNPQARVGAVGRLEMDSLADLRSDGMTASSKFKTAKLYGTQFIITCDASLRYVYYSLKIIYLYITLVCSIIELYVLHARPKVATAESGSYLFLNSRGQKFSQLGKCVIKFFKQETTYHITTTTLR